MVLEDIMLSEVNQRKTDTVWCHLYVESKIIQQTSEYNKKKKVDSQREQTSGYQWGEGGGRGNVGVRN